MRQIVSEKFNIKGYYRFVKYVSMLAGVMLPHEREKEIVLGTFRAETADELAAKSLADAYIYLIINKKQNLSADIVRKSYFILTEQLMSIDTANELLKSIYTNYDRHPHEAAACAHFSVLRLLGDTNISFAYIISNYILLKKGRGASVPSIKFFSPYKKAVENKNIDKLMFIFMQTETPITISINKNKYSRDEVLALLRKSAGYVKENCKVEKLFLYGSYAKNKIHPGSDIDILVLFEDGITSCEQLEQCDKIKKHYYETNGLHIDIIDFTHSISNGWIREMENIITII